MGISRTWPELEGAARIPENIFTHLKLEAKPSKKLTHFSGYVVSTKMQKVRIYNDHIWPCIFMYIYSCKVNIYMYIYVYVYISTYFL
jgi:hypothetical protein